MHRGDLLGGLDEVHNRLLVFGALDKRRKTLVFRSKHEEARAKQRVGTRGEHSDDVVFNGLDGHVAVLSHSTKSTSALRSGNPVGLLLLHALRPAFKLVKVVKQFLRVVGDFQIPLREVALLDFRIATPATALDNLFVRQNSLATRAPIHRRVAALDEAALPELLENPLAPAIVLWVARNNGSIPIVGKAMRLKLAFWVSMLA